MRLNNLTQKDLAIMWFAWQEAANKKPPQTTERFGQYVLNRLGSMLNATMEDEAWGECYYEENNITAYRMLSSFIRLGMEDALDI